MNILRIFYIIFEITEFRRQILVKISRKIRLVCSDRQTYKKAASCV